MNKNKILLGALAILGGFFIQNANAQLIEIHCTETENASDPTCSWTGTTNDGTIFEAESNPTEPSTGTGVFQPFVRVQDSSGTQDGYNTDATNPDINGDTKAGIWTHSVLFGDLGTVDIDGTSYYQFSLDSNETGNDNVFLDITDIQIYIGGSELQIPEDNGGYTGTQFDSSNNSIAYLPPVWTLDNATNLDVTVNLSSSICDNNGTCGSGKGDLNLFIEADKLIGNADDYFVFYTEYDNVNSGFEEWRYLAKETSVPEPGTALMLGLGLLGFGMRKKFKL